MQAQLYKLPPNIELGEAEKALAISERTSLVFDTSDKSSKYKSDLNFRR